MALPWVRAQNTPDPLEDYLRLSALISRADTAYSTGDRPAAAADYRAADAALRELKARFPDWNEAVVAVRIQHVARRVQELRDAPAVTNAPPPLAQVAPLRLPPGADVTNEFRAVVEQLRAAEADNALLLARLREALSAQPAATDPLELQRALQKIRDLEKENSLLHAASEQPAPATAGGGSAETRRLRKALEDLNRKLQAQTDASVALLAEKNLQINRQKQQLADLTRHRDAPNAPALAALQAESAALKEQLATANRDAAAAQARVQTALSQSAASEALVSGLRQTNAALAAQLTAAPKPEDVTRLTQENQQLKRQIVVAPAADALAKLTAENQTLRRDLADANAKLEAATASGGTRRQLADTQDRLASAQASVQSLQATNATLRHQLDQSREDVSSAEARAGAAAMAKVRQLEEDLAGTRKKLADADRQLSSRSVRSLEAKLASLNEEMLALRAKVAVFEAKPVPYSKDELALLRAPAATNVVAQSSLPKPKASRSTVALEVSAEKLMAAGDLPQAEQHLTEVVQKDEGEVRALCNLAITQAGQGRYAEAEATARKALALRPDDGASLGVLGHALASQNRFDDALNALSRAATLKPKDAGIQTLLGITLAEKGQRAAAETAFRRALLINPNHADAHRNLAVIYLSQEPPLVELARWHYQKSLEAGAPPSPEIEAKLSTPPAASPK